MNPITANVSVSPKMPSQKKMRHRRIGSAGNQMSAMSKSSPLRDRRSHSEPMEMRKVKMVNIETQTDLMDISSADCTPSPCLATRDISTTLRQSSRSPSPPTIKVARNVSTRMYCQSEQRQRNASPQPPANIVTAIAATEDTTDAVLSPTNGNGMAESIETTDVVMTNSDLTYHDACSSPDEQLIDAMNSNERLDMREACSDDDNLERLDRKVTEFFNENRLSLQSDNGNNGAMTDGPLMSVRRARLSINGDEVTFITHGNYANGNVKAMNNYNNDINEAIMVSSLSDQDYDEDEGDDEFCDDSCTDDDGDTDHNNYPLRRKR